MYSLDLDLMISIVSHILIISLTIGFFCTLVGALALKYFLRFIPLLSHSIIFFWAIFRVVMFFNIIKFTYMYLHVEIPLAFTSISTLAGACFVGYFVSKDLEKNYGISSKFPGPGFKSVSVVCIFPLIFFVFVAFFKGLT